MHHLAPDLLASSPAHIVALPLQWSNHGVTWLPEGFVPPARVDLATGHHLRPIREADVGIALPPVRSGRARSESGA
jgi:hypothetical protein